MAVPREKALMLSLFGRTSSEQDGKKDIPKLASEAIDNLRVAFLKVKVKVKESRVSKLNLCGLHLTDDLVPGILGFLKRHPHITQLNLGNNQITDEGAALLAKGETLKVLHLYMNRIGDAGVKSLSENAILEKLDMAFNPLSWRGVECLRGMGEIALCTFENRGVMFLPVPAAGEDNLELLAEPERKALAGVRRPLL